MASFEFKNQCFTHLRGTFYTGKQPSGTQNVCSTLKSLQKGTTNNRLAVVVAQLVERLLSIPEVRGSNPIIGKNLYIEHLFTVNCIEKEKDAVNGPIFF